MSPSGPAEEHLLPALPVSKLKAAGPIFLENPDGTITEAIPSTYKGSRSQKANSAAAAFGQNTVGNESGAESDASSGGMSDAAAVNMHQEVDFLYSRHERVLVFLLTTQFALEVLYNLVYVLRMQPSVVELIGMYNLRIDPRTAEIIFWVIFICQVCYTIVYYGIACVAVWTKRPKPYRMLANCSLVGIVILVLLAYVDKFNLLIFFLRLLAYIYARFLQGLTASLLLLPPARAAATTAI